VAVEAHACLRGGQEEGSAGAHMCCCGRRGAQAGPLPRPPQECRRGSRRVGAHPEGAHGCGRQSQMALSIGLQYQGSLLRRSSAPGTFRLMLPGLPRSPCSASRKGLRLPARSTFKPPQTRHLSPTGAGRIPHKYVYLLTCTPQNRRLFTRCRGPLGNRRASTPPLLRGPFTSLVPASRPTLDRRGPNKRDPAKDATSSAT
jgi:hypothetical protein